MNKPTTVILITGHPATGKTTLAHSLAQELTLPLAQRHQARKEQGERHPSHRHDNNVDVYAAYLQQQGPLGWVEVESTRLVLDTSEKAVADYTDIVTQVRELLIP